MTGGVTSYTFKSMARGYGTKLATTEVMVEQRETSWRQAAKLPTARFGFQAVTIDNKVFIFGKRQIR